MPPDSPAAVALGACLLLVGAASLDAQVRPDSTAPRAAPAAPADTTRPAGPPIEIRYLVAPKSPEVAIGLSLVVPGGGLFYAEKPRHGLVVVAGAVAAATLLYTSMVDCTVGILVDRCDGTDNARFSTGLALFAVTHGYSLIASPRYVREWNRRHATYRIGHHAPRAELHVAARGPAKNVGVAVSW